MNTPSHYILNLALLGKTIAPKQTIAISIGAILPDMPIFIFYFVAKFIHQLPESKIWSEAYYEPFWQNTIALFHSIPLAAIAALLFYYWGWETAAFLCLSMICHSLLDLPVHHDDAHRHFYPFSNYRFISPFSYWDLNHHAKYVAFMEMSLVLAVTPMVLKLLNTPLTKIILVLVNLVYVIGYFRFFR